VKWWSHIICGTLAALALTPDQLALYPLVVLGAVFPDVLEKSVFAPHRSMHEFALYLAFLPVIAMTGMWGFEVAALDHLIVDAMTIHGVTLFGKSVKWYLNTDRLLDNLVPVTMHVALLALLSK
jgi:membrane-bound metal-dependent hydrolase YbcI (DUF457 family)